MIIKNKYEYAKNFNKGVAIVMSDKKYGLINEKGEEIIKPIYENIREFKNGYAFII